MRMPTRGTRPRAKTIRPAEAYLSAGAEEARRLNHNYIGTEHFLSVLVRRPNGAATRLLAQLGVTAAAVEDGLECWLSDTSTVAKIDPLALGTI
jgi:ATP-dependent Clp protease ATP-binding subunit ClpA